MLDEVRVGDRQARRAAPRGLQADDAAPGRRQPDRAADVAGMGDRHQARSDRGGRAAAGARRRAARVPGIAAGPNASGWVVGWQPNSGMVVLPT